MRLDQIAESPKGDVLDHMMHGGIAAFLQTMSHFGAQIGKAGELPDALANEVLAKATSPEAMGKLYG